MPCVRELPGDWHTGLNMLTSIYNHFYVGFLDQFQDLLGWNRINKEVRCCYFHASRLCEFVSDKLMRFFIHQFVLTRGSVPADASLSAPQLICKYATEFKVFLDSMKSGEDKWIATCANFLEMSFDFFEFVKAYRLGDAVAIECGYQQHLPVWSDMGQHKYVEIHWSQQELLYRDNPFSVLQEIRLNRAVRRYLGKRCSAQDEFLEHGNRFFSEFPMPKSLVAFAFQSNYVGLGLMCKRFIDLWCSTTWQGDVEGTYTPHAPSYMTPERMLIYEVFKLLNTHHYNASRKDFEEKYVTSIKNDISTDLRREVLENSMNVSEETTSDEVLTSLSMVLGSSDGAVAGIDPSEEMEVDETSATISERVTVDEDEYRPPTVTSNKKEKRKHLNISDDPWSSGSKHLAKTDVLYDRGEVVRRMGKKIRIRKCILRGIEDMLAKEAVIDVGTEFDCEKNECNKYTRSRANNVNLK